MALGQPRMTWWAKRMCVNQRHIEEPGDLPLADVVS